MTSQTNRPDLSREVADFSRDFEQRIADVTAEFDMARWQVATVGSVEASAEWQRLAVAVRRLWNQSADFEKVRDWYEQRSGISDPVVRRELEVLYARFLNMRQDPANTEEIARLEAQVESVYNNYRGSYQGRKLSDNELNNILQNSRATAEVREAYLAGKEIGAQVAETVLKLAEIRNASARSVGYRDFYEKSLAAQELDETELFAIMEQLEKATDEPFRAAKSVIDVRQVARFGLASAAELRPWHYENSFFQKPPAPENDPMQDLFRDGKEIEELTVKTYEGLGLDIQDVLARSDLYEREGKSQHAFCTTIDRRTDNVRVLCNLQPSARWVETNLHEFGHAAYNKYLDSELPYFLRTAAHISTTEAIAMLMGRLAFNKQWLGEVKGLNEDQLASRLEALNEAQRFQLLVFMRWGLVMVYFERDMYANPSRSDLNRLWWDYVERFQLLTRPDNRHAPDWAAKIHLATVPAYYQNYLLGELTASQLQAYIEREVEGHSLVQNKSAGDYLRKLFSLGSRYNWSDTVAELTGEPLNAKYFVEQAAAH